MTLSNSSLAGQEEKGGNWKRGGRKNLFSREKSGFFFLFSSQSHRLPHAKEGKNQSAVIIGRRGGRGGGGGGGPPTLPSLSRTKSEKSRR